MVIYNSFSCEECGKSCYPMDMHNNEICKVCWLKEYNKKAPHNMTKYRKNKLLLGSG